MTLELDDYEPLRSIHTERVEPVNAATGGRNPPPELKRDDLDRGPDELGMVDDPLLQILTLHQPACANEMAVREPRWNRPQ